MKVLMTTDTIGGVWTYTMALCRALEPYRVQVALATMGRALSPRQRQEAASLMHVRVHESQYRLCWMQDAEQDVVEAGHWLLRLEAAVEPDVVHLNDLGHGNLPWRAPTLLMGHSCVASWWEAVKKRPAPAQWDGYRRLVSDGVRHATCVAAPTEAMLNALLRHYGPARETLVIPNGRDFPALFPPPSSKRYSANPFIFSAGRLWDEAKNVAVLTEVAGQLAWPVYVAGEQSDPNGGKRIPEGVHCLGALSPPEMEHWLAKASLYAAPAHYEPFGLAALEAARAGCALVLGNIESLREVWRDAAIYVDPDNPQELRDVLSVLIHNPSRRLAMAQRAWQRAQDFTAQRMASTTYKCYRNLSAGAMAFRVPVAHQGAGAYS